jgi:hypothetical protein
MLASNVQDLRFSSQHCKVKTNKQDKINTITELGHQNVSNKPRKVNLPHRMCGYAILFDRKIESDTLEPLK